MFACAAGKSYIELPEHEIQKNRSPDGRVFWPSEGHYDEETRQLIESTADAYISDRYKNQRKNRDWPFQEGPPIVIPFRCRPIVFHEGVFEDFEEELFSPERPGDRESIPHEDCGWGNEWSARILGRFYRQNIAGPQKKSQGVETEGDFQGYSSRRDDSPSNDSPDNNSPDNNSPDNNSPDNNSLDNNSLDNNSLNNNSPDNDSPSNHSPSNDSPRIESPRDSSPSNESANNESPSIDSREGSPQEEDSSKKDRSKEDCSEKDNAQHEESRHEESQGTLQEYLQEYPQEDPQEDFQDDLQEDSFSESQVFYDCASIFETRQDYREDQSQSEVSEVSPDSPKQPILVAPQPTPTTWDSRSSSRTCSSRGRRTPPPTPTAESIYTPSSSPPSEGSEAPPLTSPIDYIPWLLLPPAALDTMPSSSKSARSSRPREGEASRSSHPREGEASRSSRPREGKASRSSHPKKDRASRRPRDQQACDPDEIMPEGEPAGQSRGKSDTEFNVGSRRGSKLRKDQKKTNHARMTTEEKILRAEKTVNCVSFLGCAQNKKKQKAKDICAAKCASGRSLYSSKKWSPEQIEKFKKTTCGKIAMYART